MREYKADSICKDCARSNTYNHHHCTFTARYGNIYTAPKSGRIGLAKDGLSCKYFYKKNKAEEQL